MEECYVKESKVTEKTDKEKNIELITSILRAKNNVINARKNFEFAEGELIDYYAYFIKAEQSKLNYLIKKAKAMNVNLDVINKAHGIENEVV